MLHQHFLQQISAFHDGFVSGGIPRILCGRRAASRRSNPPAITDDCCTPAVGIARGFERCREVLVLAQSFLAMRFGTSFPVSHPNGLVTEASYLSAASLGRVLCPRQQSLSDY